MTGIPWRLAVPAEVMTEYAGTKLGDYYSNAATMLQTQQSAREQFLSLYGVDLGPPHIDLPCYVGVAALGANLVLPEDDPPMVENQGHVLETSDSVMGLEPAHAENSMWFKRYLAMRETFKEKLGTYPNMGAGQEGPVTSAVLLRGSHFYEDVIAAPELAHHLLRVVTETYIYFVRYAREVNGQPVQGSVGLCDDLAGSISPTMWPEFVVPYWQRIYEALGPGPRSVHTELLRREHLHYLVELGICSFDPGMDQHLSPEEAREELAGKIDFWWNLFTVRDMLQGTPDSIRTRYRELVDAGVPKIMTELCRGTPRENVRAFVEVARSFE